ncbi:Sec-independent protein translocase protein TatB [Chitinolyticbacter meiyuanensis]|uniref:Sec-independent protein translocase protein TatB n=1 Tax=Chitinolyticbacter meiyuanensis TaxID=682798 RepID=UPI0011E58A8B|nr:Sec-independent protein translocase protein TatB [Chitinolyticbacter meiyuanensis]
MFEVGFSELLMIGAVALIVLGPERLPKVARTVGALVGRARRFAASVKADLDREIAQTELAKIEAELRAEQDALQHTIHQPLVEARQALSVADEPATADGAAEASLAVEPVAVQPQPVLPAAGSATSANGVDPDEPVRVVDERQLDLFAAPSSSLATAVPPRDRR